MEIEDAIAFAETHHRGVLITRRRSGDPQTSLVLAGVDGDGRVIVSSREPSFKVRNLRRDPRVTVCLFSDQFFGPWIQIDGTAEIVSLPEAMEPLVDYYRRISGEHPDWDDYRAAMEAEERVLIRIAVERAGPQHSG